MQGKEIVTEGFVMRVRKNAVSVMCPRYGLEGPVYLDGRQEAGCITSCLLVSSHCRSAPGKDGKRKASAAASNSLTYDANVPQLVVETDKGTSATFRVFDRVMVAVSVDESNIQRPKIVLRLTQPAL